MPMIVAATPIMMAVLNDNDIVMFFLGIIEKKTDGDDADRQDEGGGSIKGVRHPLYASPGKSKPTIPLHLNTHCKVLLGIEPCLHCIHLVHSQTT